MLSMAFECHDAEIFPELAMRAKQTQPRGSRRDPQLGRRFFGRKIHHVSQKTDIPELPGQLPDLIHDYTNSFLARVGGFRILAGRPIEPKESMVAFFQRDDPVSPLTTVAVDRGIHRDFREPAAKIIAWDLLHFSELGELRKGFQNRFLANIFSVFRASRESACQSMKVRSERRYQSGEGVLVTTSSGRQRLFGPMRGERHGGHSS